MANTNTATAEPSVIVPETWRDGDAWIAEIDYVTQGATREDAIARFNEGWRATVQEREAAGFYAYDGARMLAAFTQEFDRELALSERVNAALEANRVPHTSRTDEQYAALCEIAERHQSAVGLLRELLALYDGRASGHEQRAERWRKLAADARRIVE